jgi:GMP synthase (glutamine-hydrolysing)
LRIVVVNNYKEEAKGKQALDNLSKCTRHRLEMLDYKTHDLGNAVSKMAPDLLILTGSNFMLTKSDTRMVFREQIDLVKNTDLPTLGICFGHQLIGLAYGSEVVDLGQTIRAYKDVKLLHDEDPIFDGLPNPIRVTESHRQGIARVPREFRHLAESTNSLVEVIAHETRPIYGVQFHPERFDDNHPHGRSIVQNFVKMAGKF